ncbi:hypothetical protein DUI87_03943 [Hirundo rustica rustica]|uniref:Uncharacterized protein n=1 Tax=Hirundo rustica rustica TaxID=333673 RepID=A0A3M0L5X2_HIRRU|nr:hypothetical protein DUI87_03943 [Hirundo rustica rustica]
MSLGQVQDPLLVLAELQEVYTDPPLKPVKVPLNGIPTLQCVNCPTQLNAVSTAAVGALDAAVITDKDVKKHWYQYQSLADDYSPLGHQAINHNPFRATIQPIPYVPSAAVIKSMSLHFIDKDVVQDSQMLCRSHYVSEFVTREI